MWSRMDAFSSTWQISDAAGGNDRPTDRQALPRAPEISAAVWILAVALLAGLYVWYTVIVRRRNRVSEALAGIDVQVNQRHDLIPNLLKIAR